jgi:SAM-dependent methyltransferase
MVQSETVERNRQGWNTVAASYQAERRISLTDVHYGPLAPGERELGLLGKVDGLRILEVGCGGGQNSIVLSSWGAACVGIDPSSAQLAHARRLAEKQGQPVQFAEGIAEDLSDFQDSSFDLVLSSFAFDYVTDLGQACSEAWRVLKPGGLFVFCHSHPWFQAVGWFLAGDDEAPDVGNYAAWPDFEEWDWEFEDGTRAPMRGHLRPLAQILNTVIDSGFQIERMVEQAAEDTPGAPEESLERLPYLYSRDTDSKEYEIMRKLPFTLILRSRKPGQE